MKKARATKILCAVLTVIMVLGTGLSAMAAVTSTSVVKYDADNEAYGVITEVSGLAENEMVTYLVHNADSMYNVTPANIDFIDQKNADGTSAQFTYKGTGVWADEANKIYVGAESLTAPVESTASVMEAGVAVKINNVLVSGLTIEGKDAAGIKTIALDCVADVADVVDVAYNGDSVEFFRIGDAIGFNTNAALNEETDVISITTVGATFTGDPTANGALSAADLFAMNKAKAPYDTGATNTSGKDIISYSNGQMALWNALVADFRKCDGGETAKDGFWYPNDKTIAELGYETAPVSITASTNGMKTAASNGWAGIEDQFALAKAAIDGGATSYDVDPTNFVPQGLVVMTAGDDIALELTVPATGDYKLVARQSAWTSDRTTNLTVNGTTLKAVSAEVQKFSLAQSAETVRLEAGTTYTATLDGTASAPVRLDFIALVPVGESFDEAYAAGKEAVIDYLAAGEFTKGDIGIKLGTVNVSANSLVAFGRAKGPYAECGIIIAADEPVAYPALGVAGVPGLSNGGFAIELIDETEGADLTAEFASVEVYAYATVNEGDDPIEGCEMAGPVVIGE